MEEFEAGHGLSAPSRTSSELSTNTSPLPFSSSQVVSNDRFFRLEKIVIEDFFYLNF